MVPPKALRGSSPPPGALNIIRPGAQGEERRSPPASSVSIWHQSFPRLPKDDPGLIGRQGSVAYGGPPEPDNPPVPWL